jgi:hypothetical protein
VGWGAGSSFADLSICRRARRRSPSLTVGGLAWPPTPYQVKDLGKDAKTSARGMPAVLSYLAEIVVQDACELLSSADPALLAAAKANPVHQFLLTKELFRCAGRHLGGEEKQGEGGGGRAQGAGCGPRGAGAARGPRRAGRGARQVAGCGHACACARAACAARPAALPPTHPPTLPHPHPCT